VIITGKMKISMKIIFRLTDGFIPEAFVGFVAGQVF